jgi:excisionase family DNA binding protein
LKKQEKTPPRKKAVKNKSTSKASNTPAEPEQTTTFPDVLTITQAMAYLQISKSTIYNLINNKEIPVKRMGGQYRFSRRQLLEWIEEKD